MISITDGQIFLEPKLFNSGVRPAINVGISVSRVGGNAQIGPMKKVAGRIKLELSQYRDLEAFAQFGSDLDADTQRTLARGERIVKTLNQNERAPLAVEDQTTQIYAATNGFLDRLNVERVPEFLTGLTERMHSEHADVRAKIAGGDWSDETQQALGDAVQAYAEDFGYDLDEEGQPLEDDAPLPPARDGSAERRARAGGPGGVAPRAGIAMASQRDVKNRIGSVKNIQKITRAMEMVAAARLRRAEQRIAALRPYADALRRMTRQAALDAGAEASRLELLNERETISTVGLLLVTGDRGLAGGFNSQVIRAGMRAGTELDEQGLQTRLVCDRAPRRVLADVPRTRAQRRIHGVHRQTVLRRRARHRGRADRGIYDGRGRSCGARLQRLRLAADAGGHARDAAAAVARDDRGRGRARRAMRRRAGAGPRARPGWIRRWGRRA